MQSASLKSSEVVSWQLLSDKTGNTEVHARGHTSTRANTSSKQRSNRLTYLHTQKLPPPHKAVTKTQNGKRNGTMEILTLA